MTEQWLINAGIGGAIALMLLLFGFRIVWKMQRFLHLLVTNHIAHNTEANHELAIAIRELIVWLKARHE